MSAVFALVATPFVTATLAGNGDGIAEWITVEELPQVRPSRRMIRVQECGPSGCRIVWRAATEAPLSFMLVGGGAGDGAYLGCLQASSLFSNSIESATVADGPILMAEESAHHHAWMRRRGEGGLIRRVFARFFKR